LLADLPVGFDPSGADAWMDQDLLALGCSVGAPPDDLGPTGQDWGLPPYVPWRLRAAGYAPWIDTLRRMFRHCDALRIDHVMGLFRLFWIPPGGDASHGGYVDQRDPAHRPGAAGHFDDSGFVPVELLDLVLMEAARAGATVVGEDLGTVEPEVRAAMSDRNVFGYRIGWFEDEPAHEWPAATLAALTTHDLPTAAGLWTGEDETDRVRAGLAPDPGEVAIMRGRLLRLASDGDALADEPMVDPSDERSVVVGAHRGLATSGSDLAVATLEDAVGALRRPNLPGTVDQHPNWRIPLPVDIEALDEAGAAEIAGVMRAAGR
jgi:4-alpha-glucanotransferase